MNELRQSKLHDLVVSKRIHDLFNDFWFKMDHSDDKEFDDMIFECCQKMYNKLKNWRCPLGKDDCVLHCGQEECQK